MSQPADDPPLVVKRIGRRRVTTKSASGMDESDLAPDPEPAEEDTARAWGDANDTNDHRLKSDKPPHW